MTPGRLHPTVVADRLAWIDRMLSKIRELPLDDLQAFESDPHAPGAAESYLRRALEALLDLGRHVLAQGLGRAENEYKAMAIALGESEVLGTEETQLLVKMAGYRNRMVHFYHRIEPPELYEICAHKLGDIESVRDALRSWIASRPDLMPDMDHP